MTDRAKKIQNGKRQRVLLALEDKKRIGEDGLVRITQDEARTLVKAIRETLKKLTES